jgi:hypothetical protein
VRRESDRSKLHFGFGFTRFTIDEARPRRDFKTRLNNLNSVHTTPLVRGPHSLGTGAASVRAPAIAAKPDSWRRPTVTRGSARDTDAVQVLGLWWGCTVNAIARPTRAAGRP